MTDKIPTPDEQIEKQNEIMTKSGVPTDAEKEVKTSNELQDYYRKFLTGMKQQVSDWLKEYDNLSFASKLQVERQLNVLNEVNKILGEPALSIEQTVKNHIITEGNDAYNGVFYQTEQSYGLNLDFSVLDPNYIQATMEKPIAGKTLSERLYKERDSLAQNVMDAITRGYLQGSGYAGIAKEIENLTEANFNQAMRIARTEAGRMASEARLKAGQDLDGQGVEMQKMWVAQLDSKTREDHARADGTILPMKADFNIGVDLMQAPRLGGSAAEVVNCRCRLRNIVHGIAPTVRRDGDGNLIAYKSYADWLKEKTSGNAKIAGKNDIIGLPKKGNPMSVDQADKLNANPNYKPNTDYAINCQRVVPAYEMRRRGYDVEALPKTKELQEASKEYEEVVETASKYKMVNLSVFNDPLTGKQAPTTNIGARTMNQVYNRLEDIVKENERYSISMIWSPVSNGAHIANMERVNGVLTIVDSQSGKQMPIQEYFKRYKAMPSTVSYQRIDNLEINLNAVQSIFKKKG